MPQTKDQDDRPEGMEKAMQEVLDFKLPEGGMEQAIKQIWDDAWNGEPGSIDEQSLMAGAAFVDNFERMLESEDPAPRNEEWINEARAQTAPIWQEAAKDLADDLLEEGYRLGMIVPEPEDNSEPSQSKED